MTIEEAKKKAGAMLDERASRSHVCSFINTLESSKLLDHRSADSLADVLASDRGSNIPVLRAIIKILEAREE